MNLQLILYVAGGLVAAQLLLSIYRDFVSPLKAVQGPFWARFTRLWYLFRVSQRHFERENIELHEKYGSIVRVAPNWYSVRGKDALHKLYGQGTRCNKSTWYDAWKHPDPKIFTLFTDRNMKRHAETKRLFSPMYSMSSLISYESYVDECVDIFAGRLSEFSRDRSEISMSHWFTCYAFDVIGCITYGERFGFLDRGQDLDGAIASIQSVLGFSTMAGIFVEWYPLAFNLFARLGGSAPKGRDFVRNFTNDHVVKQKKLAQRDASIKEDQKMRESFLAKMVRAQQEHPGKITDYHLAMIGQSNVLAGFDTTASTLSMALYFLLKNPRVLQKVREEIEVAARNGYVSTPRIKFKEVQSLPYFQAFLKEAMRMHGAVGLPMWRVIPIGGLEINGQYFPAGSVVGVNPWVSHFDEEVFLNPTEFRPERWIDSDEEKMRVMNETWMPFGLGSRACIGRHISILEMQKVIPALVRDFDFDLTVPDDEWDTQNFWFIRPTKFTVRMSIRPN